MKPLLFALFAAFALNLLSAADLTLTDGRVLRDATIVSQSPSAVTVRYAGGLTSVPKAKLSADLQAKYPLTLPTASAVQPPDGDKQARIAKARADEAARVARAKAAREERAQWLKDHPQEHEIIYRVESTSPSTSITLATPERGVRSFIPAFANGVYEEKFTATDGFRLQLDLADFGRDGRTGNFASTITLVILVDGSAVRRESLEPRSGSLELAWILGQPDNMQPEVFRSKEAKSAGREYVPGATIIRSDPGFKWGDN